MDPRARWLPSLQICSFNHSACQTSSEPLILSAVAFIALIHLSSTALIGASHPFGCRIHSLIYCPHRCLSSLLAVSFISAFHSLIYCPHRCLSSLLAVSFISAFHSLLYCPHRCLSSFRLSHSSRSAVSFISHLLPSSVPLNLSAVACILSSTALIGASQPFGCRIHRAQLSLIYCPHRCLSTFRLPHSSRASTAPIGAFQPFGCLIHLSSTALIGASHRCLSSFRLPHSSRASTAPIGAFQPFCAAHFRCLLCSCWLSHNPLTHYQLYRNHSRVQAPVEPNSALNLVDEESLCAPLLEAL